MSLKANTAAKLRSIIYVTIFGGIVGPLFTCLAFGFDLERAIKGFVAGILISFLSSYFESFVFRVKLKKLRFSFVLILRSITYIVIISFSVMLVWVLHEAMLNSRGIIDTLLTEDFRNFITNTYPYIFLFAFSFSFLMNFLIQINDLLGKGILLSYVTGRYHKPKIEERFFMFLDLESSTTIAETIGPVRYHKFMNSYFFDINDPIVGSKGEIYQYVGDEVVVSWKKNNGIQDLNCVKCYFDIKEKIDSLQSKYIREFGLIPGFKAGVHFGEVVIGEVGDSRKEIVFHGDVMNTASRIQAQAKIMNRQFLISEDALQFLDLAGKYISTEHGKFKLKGKETETVIYEVTKKMTT
ncbi:MAG TPA: adenylate/guanylate cyclase domain-containing protein [Ignavibacteria bacterium]|nr:adenylate/guanylate cyclase domain-containing protein [Ignavibacteria bacterium]HMQ97770.1 adenylate/guanylate cyclase domain-containing protein [Ignavibacteria bacterium]